MSKMRTVGDVMKKIDDIHHASSWINHVFAGGIGEVPAKCKEGLKMADELLEEYENLLSGMVIIGDGEAE